MAGRSGYKSGPHREQDQVRRKGKHISKTIKHRDENLDRYVV